MASLTRIGLDLDNTIIDYGEAYQAIGKQFGLPSSIVGRDQIRDRLRVSPPNDFEWQEFQSALYTDGLRYAKPSSGLMQFLGECLHRRIRVFIVSHKTAQTPDAFGARDLHAPAMDWLVQYEVVERYVAESDVYFCPTREEKIQSVIDLGLDAFVDDLSEVLNDPGLPAGLVRWHFTESKPPVPCCETELPSADFPSLTEWLRSC